MQKEKSFLSVAVRKNLLSAACIFLIFPGAASASFLDDAAATLPGGLAASSEGFAAAQISGFREIVDKGRDGVAFGIWTEHPAFDYDNRSEENALPRSRGNRDNPAPFAENLPDLQTRTVPIPPERTLPA